jgi:hypothetical protein
MPIKTPKSFAIVRPKPQRASRRASPPCSAEELYIALREALKLQKHYAELLNMHDGGQRRSEVFATPETWIARLRETGDLPNAEHQARCKASPECSCSPFFSGGAE